MIAVGAKCYSFSYQSKIKSAKSGLFVKQKWIQASISKTERQKMLTDFTDFH